ncbi:AraC family transcriptional regulator [Paenibacillus sp. GCM10027626]|uniref:AraC family transcriptional regulator n=1 Tax=Paenibacillus sp. GCM10027626 TaxID=3273411 RepID=UPI00363FB428
MLMHKPWFKKLLLSYLPVLIGISAVLICIFMLAAIEEGKREAARANQVFARQVLQSVDSSLRTVDQMMLNELGSNEAWSNFFNPPAGANKYLIEYELSNKLFGIVGNYPLIDSIYLVRLGDQIVMTNYSMLRFDSLPDKDFILQAESQSDNLRFWTSPRSVQNAGMPARSLFSLVLRYPLLSGENGMVVVNFQTSAIGSLLAGLSNSELSFVMLCDEAGNFMAGSEGRRFVNADGAEACTGSRVLSSVKSEYTGWVVHSGLKNEGYAAVYSFPSSSWITLAILAVLGGMGMMIYVTVRNYKPIGKIMERIEAYSSADPPKLWNGGGKDELSFIAKALDDLIKQTGEDVIFKRRLFFQELFEGSRIIAGEEWEEHTRSLGWRKSAARLQAGIMDIDRYEDFCQEYSQRDRGLLRFALTNVISELAEQQGLAIWPEWISNQRMGVLIPFHEENPIDHEASLLRAVNGMIIWVEGNLRITVTVALGVAVEQTADIGLSYESAAEALKYKSVLGNNRVITQFDMPVQSTGDVYNQLQPIRAMATAYRLGEEKWRELLEQVMGALEQHLFSRDDIVNLMNYMLYQLNKELMELPEDFRKYWEAAAASALERAISRMETLQELSRQVTEVLSELDIQLGQIREQRASHSVIQEVRAFIGEHYHNPDMSLTYIGEHFHIKSNYMSRLFKEETGENFVDYLARIRIEQAMRLLKQTELPVQEIAGLAGYSHYVSFNRVFKKIAGVTPGDYRREDVR